MKNLWIGAAIWGIALIVLGIVFVVMGNTAKGQVAEGLAKEKVTVSKDGALFGVEAGQPVADAKTAMAQANVIHLHSLGGEDKKVVDGKIVGGLSYAEMDRKDPARANYLNGVTLRNALMTAAMAFQISDFIMGVGASMILIGFGGLAFLTPVLYSLRNGRSMGAAFQSAAD